MKKRFSFLLASALAAVLCGGCAIGGKQEEEAPKFVPDPVIPAERESEAKAAAEKMALGMAEALKSGDFEKFDAVQPKTKGRMSKAAFARLRGGLTRHYGDLTGAEFFGRLDQGRVNDYMWKFAFDAPKGSKTPGHHEIVYWVRVGFANGKPMVAGFSFYLQ